MWREHPRALGLGYPHGVDRGEKYVTGLRVWALRLVSTWFWCTGGCEKHVGDSIGSSIGRLHLT